MKNVKSPGGRPQEGYELLAFMMMGTCFWFLGARLGLFDMVMRYATDHGLMNLVMLSGCMGMGAIAATVRKSVLLRKAIVARMQAEALAEATARHDALTGLANRRLFNESLEAALASRAQGAFVAVMLIDLDRFKPVNDIHGHAAGNAVLCAVAERLLALAPVDGVIARLGGDEFVALLPSASGEAALVDLAQRIVEAIRQPIPWNQSRLEVDATIGIAVSSSEADEPEALLHAADIAMYQGKREGRGTFRFFLAEMDVALKARAKLEIDLRAAIANGEIIPYYQPIVYLPEQDLVGFEVLARWPRSDDTMIGPDDFIPIAEDLGLISQLFYGVLRKACEDAKTWPAHLTLAVNVSPQQLQDARMPTKVMAILAEAGFAAGRLEIEITESALINDLDAARVALTSLQNLGVSIALDDFGTGYSSLYHLRELRFNKLKIDRSYVTALKQGSERAKLVDAIIQLGSSLSLQTTAEGIETGANLDWLSGQGCTYGQGYFFGRPMTKDDADAFIEKGVDAPLPLEASTLEIGPLPKLRDVA